MLHTSSIGKAAMKGSYYCDLVPADLPADFPVMLIPGMALVTRQCVGDSFSPDDPIVWSEANDLKWRERMALGIFLREVSSAAEYAQSIRWRLARWWIRRTADFFLEPPWSE